MRRRDFLTATAVAATAILTGCTKGLPTPPPPPEEESGERPVRVLLLSDPHTQDGRYSLTAGKLRDALNDYKALKPDLLVVNGDVTDRGLVGEYETFFDCVKSVLGAKLPVTITTGNHEFYDKDATDETEIARFLKASGRQTPYSALKVAGVHFVLLATEMWKTAPKNPDWAWLSQAQLEWFAQTLAANKDLFTIVLLHQPLQETLLWSHGGNNFAGSGQVAELKAILAKHPQVKLWLSGHTHQRIEAEAAKVQIGQTRFLGLGSTAYQIYLSEGGQARERDWEASQSRLLEIWPDRVEIKSRDHQAKRWLDQVALTLPKKA
ncbi:MAG TPA: metallophosphoesterase [Symbiobacteriaceae bacterium]|nr:metallophosphoesterase [Symbiobacteriaceae bacterium]